ncbi:hypothetical protein AB3662_12190 [Sorangium cellulosum]|uniref:hypothetical protein n=1 Tax=Sorangium cellulosum TaxID=56 RepID=UPI003D9A3E48
MRTWTSQHLKDFKLVWRDACHTMWTELAALRATLAFVHVNYRDLGAKSPITAFFHAPESRDRIDDVTTDVFIERFDRYRISVVTSRVVLLSAAFELYFGSFLDDYLKGRAKYFDRSSNTFTTEGNRVSGEIRKIRGIPERVEAFGDLTSAKLKSSKPHIPALKDVCVLRNVIAHRAGHVDDLAAKTVSTISLTSGTQVALSPEQLLLLAAPVLKLAEELDRKIPTL